MKANRLRTCFCMLAKYPNLTEPLREFIATSQLVERFVSPPPEGCEQQSASKETAASFESDETLPSGLLARAERTSGALDARTKFGRYLILAPLGQGAMGSVYLGFDTQLDRLVALKVPRFAEGEGPAMLTRFYRGAINGNGGAFMKQRRISPRTMSSLLFRGCEAFAWSFNWIRPRSPPKHTSTFSP